MHEFSWGGMIFGPLMMLVFVALIAGAVILVLRTLGAGPGRGGNARTILEERFARGEIDMDEFNARKAALDV